MNIYRKSQFSRMEELELGPTPNDEDCAQLGWDGYQELAMMEIKAYKNQLLRMFPNIPEGAMFKRKSNSHDFGTYYELAIKFPEDDNEAMDYAYNLEGNGPAEWDEAAKTELRSQGYFEKMESAKGRDRSKKSVVPDWMRQEPIPESKPDLPQPPPAASPINPTVSAKKVELVKKANAPSSVVIPPEVEATAKEKGYTINVQPSGVIEFKRPNGHPFYLISQEPSAFQNALATMKNESAESSNMGKAQELARSAELVDSEWQRGGSFGAAYWWKHITVKVNGIEVGRIQRRKGSRTGSITCFKSRCVQGEDIPWLISQALGDGTIQDGMPVTAKGKKTIKVAAVDRITGTFENGASLAFEYHPDGSLKDVTVSSPVENVYVAKEKTIEHLGKLLMIISKRRTARTGKIKSIRLAANTNDSVVQRAVEAWKKGLRDQAVAILNSIKPPEADPLTVEDLERTMPPSQLPTMASVVKEVKVAGIGGWKKEMAAAFLSALALAGGIGTLVENLPTDMSKDPLVIEQLAIRSRKDAINEIRSIQASIKTDSQENLKQSVWRFMEFAKKLDQSDPEVKSLVFEITAALQPSKSNIGKDVNSLFDALSIAISKGVQK